MPKTGSTSFVGIAYDLCKKNRFHVLHVNITANNHVLSLNNQLHFVKNVTKWNLMKPALYHGHFAFIDFTKQVFKITTFFNKCISYTIKTIGKISDLAFLVPYLSTY